MESYQTIESIAEGLFKDKGSKFLSFAIPVKTSEEAMDAIKQKRQEFFDSRHVCYAYMIGAEKQEFRSNDDGEPSGTAGKPILGQILSADLTDILIVVVRYFGGILLGTSGLINAYKVAAAEAIANSKIVKIEITQCLKIVCDYTALGFVMRMMKDFEVKIIEQRQEANCLIKAECKQRYLQQFLGNMSKNHTVKVDLV